MPVVTSHLIIERESFLSEIKNKAMMATFATSIRGPSQWNKERKVNTIKTYS